MKVDVERDDRFIQGLLPGGIASIIAETVSFISGTLGFSMMRYSDYASILLLGDKPKNTVELVIATGFATFFGAMLGVIFAYLVTFLGSSNLYLKSWFYGLVTWYLWYSILVMTFTTKLDTITPSTAVSNFVVASIYGLLLGIIYNRFYKAA